MANKYVKSAKEGAKGTNHAPIHKRTQGRKVKEDGDKVKEKHAEDGDKIKEKHGMKPHPAPSTNMHTLSL